MAKAKPYYSFRIGNYRFNQPGEVGGWVSVWLLEGKDVTEGRLHGSMPAEAADRLIEALGLPVEREPVPEPVAEQGTLFGQT